MKISIITPTEERSLFLNGLYRLLKQQTIKEWEWLIYDTSLKPSFFSDARVHYFHDPNIVSIGEKRNRLAHKASGDIIVHCDDDDYYAPKYLEMVVQALNTADFFNIHSWFNYQLAMKQFYYWDTAEETRSTFVVDSITEMKVREIDFGPYFGLNQEKLNEKAKRGYGFSFAYQKKVWEACPFLDVDLSEDRAFYDALVGKGFKVEAVADRQGKVVHVIHSSNISKIYPQYRIPQFLVNSIFIDFLAHVNSLDEN